MPTVRPNRTIRQTSPILKVSNKLAAGKHRFRLVVVDEAGNASKPTELVVTVKPQQVFVAQPVRHEINLNVLNNLNRIPRR